jgi:hypothetical protein
MIRTRGFLVDVGAGDEKPVTDTPRGGGTRWLLGLIEDRFGHHWEIGRPLVEWPPVRVRRP